jgi:WD40 repeat protein
VDATAEEDVRVRRLALVLGASIATTLLLLAGWAAGEPARTPGDPVANRAARDAGAISFVSDRAGYELVDVYTVDPDGRGLRLLVRQATSPAWSRDGRMLAYADGTGVSVLDVVRGTRRRVLPRGGFGESVTWSPDGTRIAYENDGIWTVRIAGGAPRQLTSEEDSGPQWSPDGARIAFRRSRDEDDEVWTVSADGRDERRLATGRACGGVAWSPDGRRLAFEAGGALRVVNAATAASSTLARGLRPGCSGPYWSPDGTKLAVGAEGGTYVVDLDGTARLVSRLGALVGWSPGGASLAIQDEPGDLWVVPASGGGRDRRLTQAFRYGYSIEGVGWHPAALTSSALGGKPVAAGIPSDSVAHGRTLETTSPVSMIAADGRRVAIGFTASRSCIELWDPSSGARTRFREGACIATQLGEEEQWVSELALAGERLAWSTNMETLHSWFEVITATSRAPRPVSVYAERDDGEVVGVRGSGSVLAFETWHGSSQREARLTGELRLIRADGPARVVRTDAGWPRLLDVAVGRLVLARGTQVDIVRPTGTLVRRLRVAGRPVAAGLAGARLAVQVGTRLASYDVATGRPLATWQLRGRKPRLAGVAGGLAAYVNGKAVHVLRLADGRATTIAVPAGPVEADLTSRGLFYAYRVAGGRRHGRVVFVPRARLLARFG